MTKQLTEAVNECARIVIDSDSHDLTLGARQWIWSCLGEKDQTKGQISDGHRKRYALAKSSVQKVVPFWLKYNSTADKINEILHIADQVIRGNASKVESRKQFDEFWLYADNLTYQQKNPSHANANLICYAACNALGTAMGDETFDPANIEISLSNSSLDPFESDAALTSSLVYADGGAWNKQSNPIKRREYWLWWLKDAVHAASEA